MDQQMEAIFAPLKQAMAVRNYTDADLFQIIGDFTEGSPQVAKAMAFHSRDIILEADAAEATMEYGDIVTEVYRRTFFDQEHAEKYGTDAMLKQGHYALKNFVDFMVSSFQMDDIQDAASSCSHTAPPTAQ